MIVLGRQLPDFIPVVPSKYEPRAEWRLEADARASALAKRHSAIQESIATKSRNLPPLQCGDSVVIQNKTGNRKGRWDKTGTIIESRPYNAYIVRVDGSRSPTLRNRSHLRKIKPFTPHMPLTTYVSTKEQSNTPRSATSWGTMSRADFQTSLTSATTSDTDRLGRGEEIQ